MQPCGAVITTQLHIAAEEGDALSTKAFRLALCPSYALTHQVLLVLQLGLVVDLGVLHPTVFLVGPVAAVGGPVSIRAIHAGRFLLLLAPERHIERRGRLSLDQLQNLIRIGLLSLPS